MKRLILSFVVSGLLLSVGRLSADEIKEDRLSVNGRVKVYVQADRAAVKFQIKATGKSLKAAFDAAHAKVGSIVEQLSALGLDETNLSTSFFRSSENKGGKAFLSSSRDYKVTQTAAVTTDRLELLEDVIVILSENKVEWISDVSFELTEFESLRLEAVKDAVTRAREKAEAMTELLGVSIGRVIEVQEIKSAGSNYQPVGDPLAGVFNSSRFVASKVVAEPSHGLFGQEFSFEAEVRVVFEIDNGLPDPNVEQPEEM